MQAMAYYIIKLGSLCHISGQGLFQSEEVCSENLLPCEFFWGERPFRRTSTEDGNYVGMIPMAIVYFQDPGNTNNVFWNHPEKAHSPPTHTYAGDWGNFPLLSQAPNTFCSNDLYQGSNAHTFLKIICSWAGLLVHVWKMQDACFLGRRDKEEGL